MYQHFILIYRSYTRGRRVAFHRAYESVDKIKEFLAISEVFRQEFGGISFGFHHVQTNKECWSSVAEYDRYFCDVEEVKTIDTFRKLISEDIEAKPNHN